jgi:hypothetical protein
MKITESEACKYVLYCQVPIEKFTWFFTLG